MVTPADDARLLESYRQSLRELRVRQLIVGSVVVLVLIPVGNSLDWILYEDAAVGFLAARILCDILLLAALPFLWTELGKSGARVLVYWFGGWPVLIMCWMIAMTEGAHSGYYNGLNLTIVGACLLIPFTAVEAAVYCFFVLSCYVVACVTHTYPSEGIPWNRVFDNCFYLVLTSLIGITACYYYTKRRITDFRLRYALDVQNKKLTELDKLKSQFFAHVSHELRTPLTLILSPVENLLNRTPKIAPQIMQPLRLVRQNGLRLLRLINDLLEVVRLEEGHLKLKRRPVRLNEFVAGLAESVRGLATQNGLAVHVEVAPEPLVVEGDSDRLEKVMLNLLSNAIKFTPRGGEIRVRSWRENGVAKVQVADSGVGIAPEELPFVFDRFRQVGDPAARQQQGLGLGLALAKELIEEHGGDLTASSQPNQGSTFTICLPVAAGQVEVEDSLGDREAHGPDGLVEMFRAADRADLTLDSGDPIDLSDAGAGKSTILIVDDEPDMRRFLVSTLSEEHLVIQAAEGKSALEAARTRKPDLVVLDLMLPGIDGLEVCRCLRSPEDTRSIKILMLTARMDEQTKLRALDSGVDDFLTKPFSTIEVKTRIRNLLASRALEQDLRDRNRQLGETIVKLRSTEAQLIQSEKMNALGSLAGGLLHEINNPLNHTMMALEVARMSASGEDPELKEILDDIETGMKRIGEIITDLRAFAYPEQMDVHTQFDIREAVETSLRFTASELRDVAVELEGFNGEWVTGSQTHVTQVLVNMLLNASHAMEPLRNERQPKVRIVSEPNGDRLFLRVWDNGVGIDPDKTSRVFEPFFTTRDVGQGTGLGLSICHTIVQNHGGSIEVRSEKGSWTEFTFDLPLWEEDD
jgi:signal transduction histidine kinase